MKKIVLVACGSQKLDVRSKAEHLYISPLFKKSLAYAKSLNPDLIVILSAKHGVLQLNKVIDPYNETLNKMSTSGRKAWASKVIGELNNLANLNNDEFIFLAGDNYRKYLIPHITHYSIPMQGLRIGEQLKWLPSISSIVRVYRGLSLDFYDTEIYRKYGDCDLRTGSWLKKPTIEHHDLPTSDVIAKILSESDDVNRYKDDSEDLVDFGKYVTGDIMGATAYSNDRHKYEINVVVHADVDINKLFIDGRDLLYSVVPFFIKDSNSYLIFRDDFIEAFGSKFDSYIQQGQLNLKGQVSNKLFRFVDYICMDREVIRSHLDNRTVAIFGRYDTSFFSAFAVVGGIAPEDVKSIIASEPYDRSSSEQDLKGRYGFSSIIDIKKIRVYM